MIEACSSSIHQVDAIYYAMKAIGFDNIPVVVAESGWPSRGDEDEIGANLDNAKEYNMNLIKHIMSNVGTPAKPHTMIYTYIFSLFNEDQKLGPTSERNFGLFHPDKSQVYDVGFHVASWHHDKSSRNNTRGSITKGHGTKKTWCVAKASTSEEELEASIEYACGEGGVDCGPIREGGKCYHPNTLISHASFAINIYYQLHGRNSWNCDFNGHAMLTTTDPSKI